MPATKTATIQLFHLDELSDDAMVAIEGATQDV